MIESISAFVVTPWVLVAIFGYSFNKKFLVRKVWKVIFPIEIITEIVTIILDHMPVAGQDSPGNSILFWVVVYVLSSPLFYFEYIALYRYGFSKTEPWEEHAHNND
ncbi:MAG: hypothetical protein GY777_27040 [Candidatus Brocadiaceae bacterium]|nr:hypothetical protein [Candidatus Brocadiaceae bacterium]